MNWKKSILIFEINELWILILWVEKSSNSSERVNEFVIFVNGILNNESIGIGGSKTQDMKNNINRYIHV